MRELLSALVGTVRRVLLLDIIRDKSSRPAFIWALLWVLLGTLVYHYIEGWNWLDSVYFCVVTLATVGYGDYSPTTPIAKVFTIFYIINGIGILLFFVDKVVSVRRAHAEVLVDKAISKEVPAAGGD